MNGGKLQTSKSKIQRSLVNVVICQNTFITQQIEIPDKTKFGINVV